MAGVSMEASVQRGVTSVSGQWFLFVGAVVPSFSLSQVWPFEAGRVWPDWFFFGRLVFALYTTTACCGLMVVVGLYRRLWAVIAFVLFGIRHVCLSEFRVGSVQVSDGSVVVQWWCCSAQKIFQSSEV